MADETDKTIAALAVDLNEDAKAKRKAPAKPKAGDRPEGEENLDEALSKLGEAVTGTQQAAQGAGGDLEGQHVTAIDRMENMADDLALTADGMIFDVRDFLLNQIKSRPKPWSATSQAEQRDVAAAAEHAARELVRKIVEVVAARAPNPVRVLLTKYTAGSDLVISGKVKTFSPEEEDAAVATLHRAIGKHVMLTVATAEDYAGAQRDADTDPDQNDFSFEAGGDAEDDE